MRWYDAVCDNCVYILGEDDINLYGDVSVLEFSLHCVEWKEARPASIKYIKMLYNIACRHTCTLHVTWDATMTILGEVPWLKGMTFTYEDKRKKD